MITNKARERRPTVVLVGTLDTKGKEYAYFRERVQLRNPSGLLRAVLEMPRLCDV